MVRYFYAWTPFVLIGTLCVLALPWLGLIALMVVALGALAAAAGAFVVLPYLLVRAIGRRLHGMQDAAQVEVAPPLPVRRSASDLDLAFLWRRPDDSGLVVLVDRDTGEEWELVVRDNDNAYAAA